MKFYGAVVVTALLVCASEAAVNYVDGDLFSSSQAPAGWAMKGATNAGYKGLSNVCYVITSARGRGAPAFTYLEWFNDRTNNLTDGLTVWVPTNYVRITNATAAGGTNVYAPGSWWQSNDVVVLRSVQFDYYQRATIWTNLGSNSIILNAEIPSAFVLTNGDYVYKMTPLYSMMTGLNWTNRLNASGLAVGKEGLPMMLDQRYGSNSWIYGAGIYLGR